MTTITKQGVNLARAFRPWQKFEWVLMLLAWILSWFVMSVVVFLRRNFGERYLSWLNLYFGYGAITLFIFSGPILIPFTGGGFHYWMGGVSIPMMIAWLAFVLVSLVHRFVIWKRNRNGEAWHTFSPGESWLVEAFTERHRRTGEIISGPSDEAIHKWVEPIFVLIAGVVFTLTATNADAFSYAKVFAPVGLWLIISSIALWIHARINYFAEHQQLLDMRDARIEAQYYSDALMGKPAGKTAGFVMAQSTVKAVKQDPGLKAAFEALGSDMRSTLSV